MRRNRRTFVAAIGTVLGTALAGCTGNGGEGGDDGGPGTGNETGTGNGTGNETGNETSTGDVTGTVDQAQTSDMLRIVDHSYYETASGAGIRGTVKNVGDERIIYGKVKVTPTESGDREEGKKYSETKSERIDSLNPGETTEFDVVLDESDRVQRPGGYEIWTTAQTGTQTQGGE